jgi:CHASE3 domain sensor protein
MKKFIVRTLVIVVTLLVIGLAVLYFTINAMIASEIESSGRQPRFGILRSNRDQGAHAQGHQAKSHSATAGKQRRHDH